LGFRNLFKSESNKLTKMAKFPTFWVIVLLFAIAWALEEIGLYSINLPWLPVIIVIVAIGAIFNRFNK
jgi:hypothetical protein